MTSPFQSIRWRLQAWHGLLLLLVLAGLCAPAYRLAVDNQLQRIDKEVGQLERRLFRSLMDSVKNSLYPDTGDVTGADRPLISLNQLMEHLREKPLSLSADVAALFQGHEPGYAYFSIRNAQHEVLLSSANLPDDTVFLPPATGEHLEDVRTVEHRREMRRSSPSGFRIVVGRDISPDLDAAARFAWIQAGTCLGLWVFGLLGGWWLSGRAIQPIQSISNTASRIAEGNLKERIDIADTDSELGQLSQVLNTTFERLNAAFERQKQFTADASHELRTPITILLSETQRVLKRERTAEEYQEALATCGHTAQRMRHLVEALLLLARQETTQGIPQHRERCDLAAILRETQTHLAPMAAERGLAIHTDLESAPSKGDPGALAVLTSNLVTNALQHHHGEGGRVDLKSGMRGNQPWFSVSDDGPGIPAGDVPHIFERFYRADKARTSAAGHTGLGLAIAKAIVDNHGGDIVVDSRLGVGTTFVVTLPGEA
jgi:heavy metal sensor kinase